MDNVTRDNLNALMEFDHVIEVHADGTVTEPTAIWAPEVSMVRSDPRNPQISSRQGWELLNGYSGQFTYSGPIMHDSEYIGGKMADDILAEPGVYVAVVVSDDDAEDEEDRDAGWAVARLVKRTTTTHLCDEECGDDTHPRDGREVEIPA